MITNIYFAQSTGVLEYTDCTPAERQKPHNEWPGYDTKQSDGEVQVMLVILGNVEHPFIAIAPSSTLAQKSRTL